MPNICLIHLINDIVFAYHNT